ncbi:RlpA-like double-psi beta-barrel-protein domain-containing protein-containing protein [Xylaria intraflava]|nr:RlpA-like double-psi beta-barrel-protein domain-containing protein-containing protein [Xylaria intraflava]
MSAKAMILAAVAAFVSTAAANSGDMTYFTPGLGACGWWSNEGQAVVALNTADYAGGANCGRWITIQGNGATTAAQVVDLCPGCGAGGVDVAPVIFDDIAPLSVGRVPVTWWFQ